MAKILLVEDDKNMANTVEDWLKTQQYEIDVAYDGDDGAERLVFYQYDVVILDWSLPKKTGLQICQEFRQRGGKTPILMLTGKDAVEDKETGLDSGADDYLTKPFHLRELSARLKALLRRPVSTLPETISFSGIDLDTKARRVRRDNVDLNLAPLEYKLLEFLMRNPNEVFAPEALLNRVWPNDSDASNETVRTCIKKLRKKIDIEGQESLITNLPGVGYRFDAVK
ncbi:MAG: response regulator transcription factor [Cyanobacteria bacterium SZAS LIN-5]|nr:response regulator transcription factor [Cyanobacteria bacterium SZAS LIN-5]